MVEINRTGLLVAFFALVIFFRNVFFPYDVLSRYPLYPFRMNSNFMRTSNYYFSS